MATKKAYDLAVVTGSYTDNTGTQKNRYQNIGVVLQKDDGGKFILLDRSFNPAGTPYDAGKGNTIMVSMFEPKPHDGSKAGTQGPAAQPAASADGFDDQIPF